MRNRLLLLVAALAGGVLGCGDDDGGPAPLTGPEDTADFVIVCSALGAYDIEVPASITAVLETDPTTGATMLTQVSGEITLTAATGDLILSVGGGQDTVTLEEFSVTLTVTGATPGTIELAMADVPQDIDFDANDDDVAEEIVLGSDVTETSITLDSSGTLEMVLAGATVAMSNVPVLTTLDLVVPTPVPDPDNPPPVICALPDPNTPIHFDVL